MGHLPVPVQFILGLAILLGLIRFATKAADRVSKIDPHDGEAHDVRKGWPL